MSDAVIAAALRWQGLGIGVVPLVDIAPGQLVPGIRWQEDGPLRSEKEIRAWWTDHPTHQLAITLDNPGIRLGCIDDDSAKHPPPHGTPPLRAIGGYEERTRSGGRHLFFSFQVPLPPGFSPRVTQSIRKGAVDVLAGGIVYVAPTVNHGRGSYTEVVPLEAGIPSFASVRQALEACSDGLYEEWRAHAIGEVDGPGTGRSGGHGDFSECYRKAVKAVADGADEKGVQEAVGCAHPEWSDAQIHRTVARIRRWLAAHPARDTRHPPIDIAPPPLRKLPTGDEVAWSIPGDGSKSSDLCGTIQHYAHWSDQGVRHYRSAPHSCNRRECPTCFGRVAHREARAAERAVYRTVAKANGRRDGIPRAEKWSSRPWFITLTPPVGTIERILSPGEYVAELRPMAYGKARLHGVIGGALALHTTPVPTFVGICVLRGGHPVKPGNDRDGWSVELHPVRGSVFEALRWVHARAAVPYTAAEVTLAQAAPDGGSGGEVPSAKVTPRVHSVTWFGNLSYASRERVETPPEAITCVVCGLSVPLREWRRQIWVGSGPPPRGHGVCDPKDWVEDPIEQSRLERDPDTGEVHRRARYAPGYDAWVQDRVARSRSEWGL